jgi:hypothetical protein
LTFQKARVRRCCHIDDRLESLLETCQEKGVLIFENGAVFHVKYLEMMDYSAFLASRSRPVSGHGPVPRAGRTELPET